MIREIIIDEFVDEKSGKRFEKSFGYENDTNAILFEKTGHIIILDKTYIDELKKGKIPAEIERKLYSRMFVNEKSCISDNNTVCGISCRPEFFMIDLTKKCNMHCKYCLRDVSLSDISISEKSLIDICDFIKKYCQEHKIKDVTIQPWGGEPLIELSSIVMLRKLLSGIETKVHFSVETNALLLDENTIKLLYDNRIGIGISIDGYRELHDAQRVHENGSGTHEIVEKNLLLAKKLYEDRLGTITTITRLNASNIETILEYYAKELKLKNVKFNYVHESMFTECSDLCLSKEQIAETEFRLLNKLVELNENGYNISEYNISVKLKNLLLKKYSDICHSCGCSGGKKMIVFDMHGNIFPCELTDTPEEKIGSIYDGVDLIDMVKAGTSSKDFFIPKKSDKCSECVWYTFCKGGCTVRAISIGKRPPETDEIECAVNCTLYPELLKLILEKPFVVNKLIEMDLCGK